ncbi:hypothetical protein BJX61DRAFT_544883 [Aspergillus egyptiacus]|nr:hypothetical protein BJX61DRAFT_544883 [Aspergillus egyptiacus]
MHAAGSKITETSHAASKIPGDDEPTYQVYVGIHSETATTDTHYALILRNSLYLNDPSGDCTWYHSRGGPFEETNPYRRVENEPRRFDNTFFDRKIPIGMFVGRDNMLRFEDAFNSTPPQPSAHFVARVLRKLVIKGILSEFEVAPIESQIERRHGPCPEGLDREPGFRTPIQSRGGSPLMFDLEL